MFYEEMQAVVDRVAELLPEPPPRGDLGGYARWEALTLDAGSQLAALADADTALLRNLISDDHRAPVAHPSGRRRALLLRVALYAALQIGVARPPAGIRHLRLSGGAIARARDAGPAGVASRRPGLNAG